MAGLEQSGIRKTPEQIPGEITRRAVQSRVLEFFDGIDLRKDGDYTKGILDIKVNRGQIVSQVAAFVNGSMVAMLFRENFDFYYHLIGSDNNGNRIRIIASDLMGNSGESTISVGKESFQPDSEHAGKYQFVYRVVEDPSERAEIAKTLGVEV